MLSLKTGRRSSKIRHANGVDVARRTRNVTISIVVLLVLIIGSGLGYTWYVGKHTHIEVAEAVDTSQKLPDPFATPKKMAPDAAVGVSVQMITSPLVPGMNAMVNVKTNPEAKCKISVTYNNVASTDSGLVEKVADDFGVVSWTWTVEQTAPLGSWPVTITCANEKKSGVVTTNLKLEKTMPEATAGN